MPGGPTSRTPLGGSSPNLAKISGRFRGISTKSRNCARVSPNPPTSSAIACGFSVGELSFSGLTTSGEVTSLLPPVAVAARGDRGILPRRGILDNGREVTFTSV